MNKKTYFLNAIKQKHYESREWLVSVFGIIINDETDNKEGTPYLFYRNNAGEAFTFDENNNKIIIENIKPDEPVFNRGEYLTITKDDGIENFSSPEPVETTYRNVLLNLIILVYPFGNRVPFVLQPFNVKNVEKTLVKLLTDDNGNQEKEYIYYNHMLKYSEAMDLIRGIAYLVNPSGSRKTFTVAPEVIALRNSLYEQYKDDLDNPVTLSTISKQLEEADRLSMKGDVSEGFFSSAKLWNVARMKTFIMLGLEPTLSKEMEAKPVLTSLAEGWKVKDMSSMINGQRYGSYARGKLTEFGGVIVNLTTQAFRDSSITEEDCGSLQGLTLMVEDSFIDLLEGSYELKTLRPLDSETLKSLVGKEITIRTPSYCKTPSPGYCSKCIGQKYSSNPAGLPMAASGIGSTMMGISMGRMHGKAMRVKHLNVFKSFS